MVDSTDFASVESSITASDFNSGATKKFFGVNHGGSAAFTSGSISKAATLVTSGIFQQTLKAAECNYDYLTFVFRKTGCADQILIFETGEDVASQLSDANSNLLSYLVGMSGYIVGLLMMSGEIYLITFSSVKIVLVWLWVMFPEKVWQQLY